MLYPEPIIRPLPKPPELIDKTQPKQSTELDPNVDFEENSPHQEGIISETYKNPDQTYFERPQELTDLINTTKFVQKYLPRQVDIDKILDVIKRKSLERHTFAPYHQRNTGRLFDQSLLQGHIQIPGSKHFTKEKACKTKGRKPKT